MRRWERLFLVYEDFSLRRSLEGPPLCQQVDDHFPLKHTSESGVPFGDDDMVYVLSDMRFGHDRHRRVKRWWDGGDDLHRRRTDEAGIVGVG